MGKNNSIRYSHKDEARLKKSVNNFNAKRRRIIARDPMNIDAYPERASLKELRNNLKQGNRQDYKREIESLQAFSKKGVERVREFESGLKLTEWEYKDMKKRVDTQNRQTATRKEKYDQLKAKSRGKVITQKRSEMGTTQDNEFRQKRFNPNNIRKGEEWKQFKRSVNKHIFSKYENGKASVGKANYIQALITTFGDKATPLIEKIRSMSDMAVGDIIMVDTEGTFDFTYNDPLAENAKLKVLGRVWGIPESEIDKYMHGEPIESEVFEDYGEEFDS